MATLRSAQGVPVRFRATGNPGGPGHCVPFGEVLTPSGWRDVKTMKVGDSVYTVDQAGQLKRTRVEQVHASHYEGDLIHVSGRGLSMICTPNHRVAKTGGERRFPNRRFSLVPFNQLPGQVTVLRSVQWAGTPIGEVRPAQVATRKRKLAQPRALCGGEFAALCGWMVSEGYRVDRDKAFGIAQCKPEGRTKIRALLERCGFVASWSAAGVTVYAPDWWNLFRSIGERCRTKRVPSIVKNATKPELRAFFDAAMAGDGHWCSADGGTYYTISKALADDMAEVALKLGYIVFVSQRERKDRNGPTYQVNFKRTLSGGTEILTGQHVYDVPTSTNRKSNVKRLPYRGKVYCIGVPETNTFILRQNGSVWVSGNSWVKARYIDPAPKGYKVVTDRETGTQRVFIPARLEDNPALTQNDPGYERRLRSFGSPGLVKAWRWGIWDIVAGGFFDDIWRPDRHVLPVRAIPASWRRRRSFDWGSTSPASLGLWAVADGSEQIKGLDVVFPRGSLIRIGELYTVQRDEHGIAQPNVGLRWSNERLGMAIAKASSSWPSWSGCVADPSIFTGSGGPSIYKQLRDAAKTAGHTLVFTRADNSRVAGWQSMRTMLEESGKDRAEKPGLWIMENNIDWIRTVPVLQRDRTKGDDVDTEAEDHAGDDTRYACHTKVRTGSTLPIGGH